jgi:hypothetical protein
LAIHAGLSWSIDGACDERVLRLMARHMSYRQQRLQILVPSEHPERLVFGKVLAVVDLVDCHLAQGECCAPWGESPAAGAGHPVWHWVLRNVRRLAAPVCAVGQRGLWDVELEPLETLLAAAAGLNSQRDHGLPGWLSGPTRLWLKSTLTNAAFSADPSDDTIRLARFLRRATSVAVG